MSDPYNRMLQGLTDSLTPELRQDAKCLNVALPERLTIHEDRRATFVFPKDLEQRENKTNCMGLRANGSQQYPAICVWVVAQDTPRLYRYAGDINNCLVERCIRMDFANRIHRLYA